MIGRDYFDLRSQLDAALIALGKLSSDCSSDNEQAAAIDGLIDGLKKPFAFVVIGEVNADKPAFLKAISGADFSAADAAPAPVDFRRSCNIVDLPLAVPLDDKQLKTAGRSLTQADIVIVLFTALNPWDAPAWRLLEQIHPELPAKVIAVLQHSDQREPEEIQSILAYMKRLCVRRFNREFPVFPVSANRACLARGSSLDGERLLSESGFQNLEQHISEIISSGGSQHEMLSDTLKAARQILRSLQHELEKDSGQRMKQTGALRKIDSELAAQAQRTFDKISDITGSAADELRLVVQGMLAAVAEQFKMRSVLYSLFQKNRSSGDIKPPVQQEVAGFDQKRWNDAATVLESDVCAMADQVRKLLAEELNVETSVKLKPDAVFWAAQRGRFLAQASGIQQRAYSALNITQHLSPALESSRQLARRQLKLTAVCFFTALALAVTGHWIFAGFAAVAAVLMIVFLDRTNARQLARTLADCDSHLSGAPVKMKQLLDQQLRDETENLFELFNHALRPLREKINEEERGQMMLHRQMENVGRAFDDLDAELGTAATPSS